jgi:CTP:molybdopterin cytidylyltransferase MocA
MPATLDPDLVANALREDRVAAAARRANERWVTYQRVWCASERAGIEDEHSRAIFIAHRLWPDLSPETLHRLADAAVAHHGGVVRPVRASQVVGERLERLMAEAGYRVTAA